MKKMPIVFLVILLLLIKNRVQAQINNDSLNIVSNYFHTTMNWWDNEEGDSLIGFSFKNIDTLGKENWKSGLINQFDNEGYTYYIKANFPKFVSDNSKQLWCAAVYVKRTANGYDTINHEYGGIVSNKIKLLLKSTPEGAETFLIPNRIWLNKFENTLWNKDASKFEEFRVNTSNTNTYALVDETVFVVIYKKGDQFKKIVHHTKPATVEQEQTISVNF